MRAVADGAYANLELPRVLRDRGIQGRDAAFTTELVYGRWDADVLKHVKATGYLAAFTVRRQANPAFVQPLTMHRSQIYADMTLEDFAKNLTLFQEEDLR